MGSGIGQCHASAGHLAASSTSLRSHSDRFRWFAVSIVALVVALSASDVFAQAGNTTVDIQNQLISLYPTAKITADGTDLVAAGAVIVLQKDSLLMCKVALPIPTPNVFKNGVIAPSGFFGMMGKLGVHLPAAAGGPPSDTREFVSGEKFWISKIEARPDGVTFYLISDPIQDQRYHGTLKFPYGKGASPTVDEVANLVSQAFKVDASSDAPAAASQGAAQSPQQAAAPAETKTIKVGQTRDHVISVFGEPTKIVQLGKKEIDYFPDMKVTFIENKVTDVN
jgi:hypothetical protein